MISTLNALFDEAAARWPERIALRCDGRVVTYAQLDAMAGCVQRNLASLQIQKGERVVLYAEKSIESVAVLLGICRAGCIYVPIDRQVSAQRLEDILDDCVAALLVVDESPGRRMRHRTLSVNYLLKALSPLLKPSPAATDSTSLGVGDPDIIAEDLAYILYTSGSTGLPKGVAVTHRAALAFLTWARDEFDPQASDVFANHASLAFDLSVLDLYLPMFAGAAVVLIRRAIQIHPGELTSLIASERITVWYSVPSALILMARHGGLLDEDRSGLRLILFAGEPFPVADLRPIFEKLSHHAKFYNLYGPTETNVCSFHQVMEIPKKNSTLIPIGRQCSGNRLYVEDRRGNAVTEPGKVGVLWVEGDSVMAGYWGNLFETQRYCTGDVVTFNDHLELIYLGRQDQLVKIRGARLSLLAVEMAVSEHTARDVCAMSVGVGADAKLIVLVAGLQKSDDEFLVLQSHCKSISWPERPDLIFPVSQILLNANGKKDRLGTYRLFQKHAASTI